MDRRFLFFIFSSDAIVGEHLDTLHHNIKEKSDEIIASQSWLNVVTDESGNINKARTCNISIHIPYGSLFYLSEEIGAIRMNATGAANWLKFHLQLLSNGDLNRINSISTDTCSTMLKMRDVLRESPEFKHCFFIPCDSHGLQLLCKDILAIPRFHNTHEAAQAIVKAFKNAPLQYARLREYQRQIYNKNHALILSVITTALLRTH